MIETQYTQAIDGLYGNNAAERLETADTSLVSVAEYHRPETITDALDLLTEAQWEDLYNTCFDGFPVSVDEVLEQIRQTNIVYWNGDCKQVWIDPNGLFTLSVY